MKRIALLFILLISVSCGEDEYEYSKEQQEIFGVIAGEWSQDGDSPDYFIFKSPYKESKAVRDYNGNDFYAQGECEYSEFDVVNGRRTYNCYYWISRDGSTLRAYDIEEDIQLDVYEIVSFNGEKMTLYNKDPYHLGIPMKVLYKK